MSDPHKLMESEQRCRSLFENNPDLVLFQNRAGTIPDANQAFLRFLGKTKAEVPDRPLTNFLPPERHALKPPESALRGRCRIYILTSSLARSDEERPPSTATIFWLRLAWLSWRRFMQKVKRSGKRTKQREM